MFAIGNAKPRTGDGSTVERDRVRGLWLRGREPKHLVLTDGSLLRLAPETANDGCAAWRREGGERGRDEPITVPEAREIAGSAFSRYVLVRTRVEVEWLRELGRWCECEAERLEHELRRASE